MKKQIYGLVKWLLVLVISVSGFSSAMAQRARMNVFMDHSGAFSRRLSTDGQYFTFGVGNTGTVWNRAANEYTSITGIVEDVSNDGTVVGRFNDESIQIYNEETMEWEIVSSGGWWKDGIWHSLGGHPDHPIKNLTTACGSSAVAITADGQYIAGYVSVNTTKIVPCVWKRTPEGEYRFEREYQVNEGTLQGGRAWDISDDGNTMCGWDSQVSTSNWIGTIWTSPNTTVKPQGSITAEATMFTSINPQGTKAVGYHNTQDGIIFGIDGNYELFGTGWSGISSSNIVVGNKYIWTEKLGRVDFVEYLKKIWSLDFGTQYTLEGLTTISADGKYIAGYLSVNGIPSRYAFDITFDGYPVPLAPDIVNTSLDATKKEVAITWEKPVHNGYEPLGYYVYRGDEKLNDEMITGFEFIDNNPVLGANCYSVSTVYQYDKQVIGDKSVESCVEVIGQDGCYAPKKVAADIVYNRTVTVSWGMPLPNYKSDKKEGREAVKITPNYLKTYTLRSSSEMSVASDGKNIYTLAFDETFNKYSTGGQYIESFKTTMGATKGYSGLTYDGSYFYSARSFGYTFFKLDLAQKAELGSIAAANQTRRTNSRITYIPTYNDGNGGFEAGYETSSYLYSKDFTTEIEGLKGLTDNIFGTAYYDGKIYASVQNEGELKIKLFDATTGDATGEYIDLKDYANLTFSPTATLAGLTTFDNEEGMLCLAIVVVDGDEDVPNQLVFLQLEVLAELEGYYVFRDDVKLNSELITEMSFTENLYEEGEYTYHVTALFTNNCESNPSFPVIVNIMPSENCNVPTELKAEPIRNTTQLTWRAPSAGQGYKLVGYNVYRDNKKISKDLVTNTFYTDTDLQVADYSYNVEAFYDNSCTSAQSTPTLCSIKGLNPVTPPTNLTVNINDNSQAILNWDTPSVGDYKVLRWHNGGIEWTIGEADEEFVYVGSKWDAKDLSPYFDYTLTEVEFFPATNIPHTFYVYVDGKVVLEQELATVNAGQFNLITLKSPILMEYGKELLVAYKVAGKTEARPIGADKQSINAGKGDLISYDGVTWQSFFTDYKTSATWAISIRLMPYSVAPTSEILNIKLASCPKGNVIVEDNEVKSEKTSIFVNKEVTGYNIYRDGAIIETVTDNNYTATITPETNSCYEVEAKFTNGRLSAKTSPECVYGECQPATDLTATAVTQGVTLKWTAPTGMIAKAVELRFCGDDVEDKISFTKDITFYALLQMTVVDLANYKNLKLKSIDAYMFNDCEVSLVVMQDGVTVLNENMSGITPESYNKFVVPREGLEIDRTKNLLVGLKISAPAGSATLGVDNSPAISYRGDIISSDGTLLEVLKDISGGSVNNNWNMIANFEQTTLTDETIIEYNIFRNGEKIGTINAKTFSDETVTPDTEYEYHITTLWNTGCVSEASNKFRVRTTGVGVDELNASNISIFPNPATNRVNVRGEYNFLRMYNSAGIMVIEQLEKSNYINIESLKQGVYIIEFSNETGIINRTKLVITK